MYSKPRLLPAGDRALVVEFGNKVSLDINKKVRALVLTLHRNPIAGVEELVPSYRSVLIYYDPLRLPLFELEERLGLLLADLAEGEDKKAEVTIIPVCYGGEYGPDLADVAQLTGLKEDEVIEIHTGTDYYIYMLGFTPGYPYLGGLDQRLIIPRLQNPRTRIPAGSVALAGNQTGIYPIESPGGWRLIGRTPLRLYDPNREPPVLLSAGNYVRFQAISPARYRELAKQEGENNAPSI
ncbi:MAG: 5-oxoprolinase subunit PxpB [bacterium]